jgi:hypothetical protein
MARQRIAHRLAHGLLCLLALALSHPPRATAQQRRGTDMALGWLEVQVVTDDGNEVGSVRVDFDGDYFKTLNLTKQDKGEGRVQLRRGNWDVYAVKPGYVQLDNVEALIGQTAARAEVVVGRVRRVSVLPGRKNPRIVLVLHRGQEAAPARQDECTPPPAGARRKGASDDSPDSHLWGRIMGTKFSQGAQPKGVAGPMSGARVALSRINFDSGDEELLGETRSERDGCFRLLFKLPKFDANDSYLFSVSRGEYRSHKDLLTFASLEEKTKAHQLVTLEAKPPSEGEPAEPLLETREATRRHVFAPEVMEMLPLHGIRNFDSLALLAPGVAPPPETPNTRGPGVSPGLGTAGQFSINGLRPRENNFTVDGSDNNDEDIGARRQGFVALAPLPVESLNEFQVITALADARYGRNIGGQVNVLTKGGTSKFHGSLYGFVTDSRLNARGPFDQTAGDGPPSFALRRQSDGAPVLLDGRPLVTPNPVGGESPLTRTQFGYVVGGPVEKLRAFFFTSLERVHSRAGRESHFVVPTVEQRGLFDAGATGLLLNSRPVFPSTIPGDAIFSLYPFPNNPLGPFGRNTYTAVLPAGGQATRFSAKLDRQFGNFDGGEKRPPWSFFNGGDTLSGRYTSSKEESVVPVTGEAIFSSLRPKVRTQNIAFFLDRSLTRKVGDAIRVSVGHTRLTFDEVRDPTLSPSSFFPGEKFLLNAPLLLNVTAPLSDGTLTQPAYISASSQQGAALLAARGYSGVTLAEQIAGPLGQVNIPGFSPLGVDVFHFPQSRSNTAVQVADTVTYASRKGHVYTFGADIRKTLINSTLDRNFRPLATFGGLRSSAPSPDLPLSRPGGGGSLAASQTFPGETLAAAGVPTGLFQTLAVSPNSSVGIRYTQMSFFAQSDWSLGERLHLNLDARFNYLTRLSTKGNTLENAFDRAELEGQGRAAVEDCVRLSDRPDSRADCEAVAGSIVSSFPTDFVSLFGGDKRDFDVRLGVAWALDKDKTVLRAGFGTYSGEFPGIVIGQSRNTFPNFLPLNLADFSVRPNGEPADRVFLFNPANPVLRQSEGTLVFTPGTLNTLAPGVNAVSFLTSRLAFPNRERPFARNVLGLDLVLPQAQLATPYSLQYAVTLERKLAERYSLSVAYVGTHGVKLLRLSTPDLGLHRSRLLATVGLAATTQGDSPFPFFGGVLLPPQQSTSRAQLDIARTLFESSSSSTYNSLQVELRKQYSRRFHVRSSLTYSHAIDDASDFFDGAGSFALPQNSLERSERASSSFDVKLRSATHFVRDFPKDFFFSSGPSNLGGWQLAGILTAQTGQPFTVNSAFDINRDGNLTDRLDNTSGLIRESSEGGRVRLGLAPGTNPLDLLADDGEDGRVGRNTFRAPGQFNFDLSVTKFFNFNERVRLHARAEIFNLFNRVSYGIPVRILESPAFGRATYTTTPPRTVQFAVKLLF